MMSSEEEVLKEPVHAEPCAPPFDYELLDYTAPSATKRYTTKAARLCLQVLTGIVSRPLISIVVNHYH
jgi:hypothetical protein